MLAVQTLFCALYASLVMFRALKRDYEASIMSAAFCGFALGATATAIANMQALTRRHGPAPEAFIVVPVTGAFLVDILNVIVLTSLISLPSWEGCEHAQAHRLHRPLPDADRLRPRPDADALRADVERGLTATYGADQFKIADLKRRGSRTAPRQLEKPGAWSITTWNCGWTATSRSAPGTSPAPPRW